jgi:Copine/C2 domain
MRLQLSVWAEDLPNVSTFGAPNPFAVVTVLHKEPGVKPSVVGKTEVIQKTKSPDWTKIFVLDDFELGKPTHLVVSIYDSNQNHPMGSSMFEVGSILGAPGNIVAKELKGGGVVAAHVEKVTDSALLHFQLRGLGLTNTEGMGIVRKSDPFFELQRLRQSVRSGGRVWDAVFRSHPVDNSLSPIWSEGYVEIAALCGEQRQEKFRLAVYDYEKNGKHEFMGEVQLSVDEMINSVVVNGLADKSKISTAKALTLKNSGKDTGKIIVVVAEISETEGCAKDAIGAIPAIQVTEAEIVVTDGIYDVASPSEDFVVESREAAIPPTFVTYISGGCKLHVIVAIDSTASNGDPRQPMSLHHFKEDGRNDYEDALFSICSILSKYDSDQKYPVYGFGAKRDGAVSHCFPIGSTALVEGVEGILNAYGAAFRTGMVMSSPRDYSQVVRAAATAAKEESVSICFVVSECRAGMSTS